MTKAYQKFVTEDESREDFEPIKTSRTIRILRAIIAIIAIVGLLQLSSLYQYSFFRRTPQKLAQAPLENQIISDQLTVPLSIYIVKSKTPLNSSRTNENIKDIVTDAGNIWRQANINLQIKSIEEIELSIIDTLPLYAYPRKLIKDQKSERENTIKIFFTRTLNGLNGIAYVRSNSLTIADYTAGQDFRVLAHEIGHILGLAHIPKNTTRLMFEGANGTNLSKEEIKISRNYAQYFN